MTGEEFREIRLRLGLSQSAMAKVLGYRSSQSVSGYERQARRRQVPHQVAMLMRAFDGGYRPDNWPGPTRGLSL